MLLVVKNLWGYSLVQHCHQMHICCIFLLSWVVSWSILCLLSCDYYYYYYLSIIISLLLLLFSVQKEDSTFLSVRSRYIYICASLLWSPQSRMMHITRIKIHKYCLYPLANLLFSNLTLGRPNSLRKSTHQKLVNVN